MRNVIDNCRLTSVSPEGRRRFGTARRSHPRRNNQDSRERLVMLGSRVVSLAQESPRRRGPSERCQRSSVTPPQATGSRLLEQEWLHRHRGEYAGAWVALEGTRLVAVGSSARQVLDAAKLAGYEQPLVVHIPSEPELPFGGW